VHLNQDALAIYCVALGTWHEQKRRCFAPAILQATNAPSAYISSTQGLCSAHATIDRPRYRSDHLLLAPLAPGHISLTRPSASMLKLSQQVFLIFCP